MKRKIIVSFVVAILSIALIVGLVSCKKGQKTNSSAYVNISMGKEISSMSTTTASSSVNTKAEIELIINEKGNVTAINGKNDNGKIVVDAKVKGNLNDNFDAAAKALVESGKKYGFVENRDGYEVNVNVMGEAKDAKINGDKIKAALDKNLKAKGIKIQAKIEISSQDLEILKKFIKEFAPKNISDNIDKMNVGEIFARLEKVVNTKAKLATTSLEKQYKDFVESKVVEETIDELEDVLKENTNLAANVSIGLYMTSLKALNVVYETIYKTADKANDSIEDLVDDISDEIEDIDEAQFKLTVTSDKEKKLELQAEIKVSKEKVKKMRAELSEFKKQLNLNTEDFKTKLTNAKQEVEKVLKSLNEEALKLINTVSAKVQKEVLDDAREDYEEFKRESQEAFKKANARLNSRRVKRSK